MQRKKTKNQKFLRALSYLLLIPWVLLANFSVVILLFIGVVLFLPILALLLLTHFAVLIFGSRHDNKITESLSIASPKDEKIDPIFYARRASREIN